MGKSGPLERARLANQIQGYSLRTTEKLEKKLNLDISPINVLLVSLTSHNSKDRCDQPWAHSFRACRDGINCLGRPCPVGSFLY